MCEAVDEIKKHAELLHKAARSKDADERAQAFKRLARLAEFRDCGPGEIAEKLQHKHCLAVLATEVGFGSWRSAKAILEGGLPGDTDFGTLLSPRRCGGFLNEWFADHALADAARQEQGGYLLPYRRQFMLVRREYISLLGIDPNDEGWPKLNCDWIGLKGEIRRRFYGQVLRVELAEASANNRGRGNYAK